MSHGLIQYAIVLPILYLGFVASIEDFRFGKIYKHHITMGLYLGVAWYALLALFYGWFFDDWSVLTVTIPKVLVAVLFGFAVAGGMWWFDVWSAGDAKLFTVFVLLTPPAVYMSGKHDYLASIILMVNAYAVAFVVIGADFLIRLARRIQLRMRQYRGADDNGKATLRSEAATYLAANWFGWVKTFLGFTFILLMVRMLRSMLRGQLEGVIHIDDTLLFLILFLAFRPLHRLFQIRAVAAVIIAGLLVYVGYQFYLDPSGESLRDMGGVGLIALALLTFRQIYSYWSKLVEVTTIPLEQLREHMIISEKTREALVRQQVFTSDEMKEIGVEGLSEEHARRIRQLYKPVDESDALSEREDGEHSQPELPDDPGNGAAASSDTAAEAMIEVEKTIPFAPFIFAGLLVTFYAHGVLLRFH